VCEGVGTVTAASQMTTDQRNEMITREYGITTKKITEFHAFILR
jgi:hypothetical protein